MQIVRGHHFSFAVADLAQSKAFYGDVLGLQEIDRPDFSFAGAMYQCGETQVHLIHNPQESRSSRALSTRANHSAFQIENFANAIASLEKAGIEFSDKGAAVGQIFLQDPDGNCIELIQPGGHLGRNNSD